MLFAIHLRLTWFIDRSYLPNMDLIFLTDASVTHLEISVYA